MLMPRPPIADTGVRASSLSSSNGVTKRRRNGAGSRRSCSECVTAKRKCDRGLPCARCRKQSLSCQYSHTTFDEHESGGQDVAATIDFGHEPDPAYFGEDDWANIDLLNVPEPTDAAVCTFALDSMPVTASDPFPRYKCPNGELLEERLAYCKSTLMRFPEMLLSRGGTPFIHPHAFDMHLPKAMRDVYAAIALHASSNSKITRDLRDRSVQSYLRDLVQVHGTGLQTPLDQLANLQALLLFAILGLFHSKCRLRTIIEQYSSTLQSWTLSLEQNTKCFENVDVFPERWQDWIFLESARRTVILSNLVESLSSVERQGHCSRSGLLRAREFTAQTRLWNAPTAFNWRALVKQFPPYVICGNRIDELCGNATIDDVEELSVMFMVCFRGLDDTRQWMSPSIFEDDKFKLLVEDAF